MKDDICNYGMTEIPDWFTAEIEKNGKARRAEMLELADALDKALHRIKLANRLLTFEEVVKIANDKQSGTVYVEHRPDYYNGEYAQPVKNDSEPYSGFAYLFRCVGNQAPEGFGEDEYEITYRCWLYKPTEEERSGTPWKK